MNSDTLWASKQYIVPVWEYLRKARNMESKKQPVLGSGYVTCNNGVTVESGDFCAILS
jgi:hypothetical protein